MDMLGALTLDLSAAALSAARAFVCEPVSGSSRMCMIRRACRTRTAQSAASASSTVRIAPCSSVTPAMKADASDSTVYLLVLMFTPTCWPVGRPTGWCCGDPGGASGPAVPAGRTRPSLHRVAFGVNSRVNSPGFRGNRPIRSDVRPTPHPPANEAQAGPPTLAAGMDKWPFRGFSVYADMCTDIRVDWPGGAPGTLVRLFVYAGGDRPGKKIARGFPDRPCLGALPTVLRQGPSCVRDRLGVV